MGTLQHPDSQVNAMEISPDGQLLAACGYQHIRMFDVHNTKPNPVVNFEGMNPILIWRVSFHKSDFKISLKIEMLIGPYVYLSLIWHTY